MTFLLVSFPSVRFNQFLYKALLYKIVHITMKTPNTVVKYLLFTNDNKPVLHQFLNLHYKKEVKRERIKKCNSTKPVYFIVNFLYDVAFEQNANLCLRLGCKQCIQRIQQVINVWYGKATVNYLPVVQETQYYGISLFSLDMFGVHCIIRKL